MMKISETLYTPYNVGELVNVIHSLGGDDFGAVQLHTVDTEVEYNGDTPQVHPQHDVQTLAQIIA